MLSDRRRARRATAPAVLLAAALGLAGCVAPKQQTTVDGGGATAGHTADVGGDLESYYGQDVRWAPCGDFECATVRAPLDWADPSAGSIDLAINRAPATGTDRIGSLLINPGGPGGSGTDYLQYGVEGISPEVLAAYDVVGFDPRGVGASSAVDCGPDSEVDAFLTADAAITDQGSLDEVVAQATAFGERCLDNTGPLLGHVDTESAARDLDLLRAVLGDAQLHYLGFSYGTFLGATYAGLYPQNVGRLVLDGALDPTLTNDELALEQAAGFEQALRSYVADCRAGAGCPLTGSVDDGLRQIADVVARAERRPLDAGDGYSVNGTLALYGIIVTLYDDSYWSLLTGALAEAIQRNTGSQLLDYANAYLERTRDGTYLSNSNLAFTAINCLDYPTTVRDYDQMVAYRDQVAEVAPTFATWFAMAPGCETWPFQSTREPTPIVASGAAPILVVGTTGDPATPYAWSKELAGQLESGTLLTWNGEGHTAYGRAGECITAAVDAYLLRGEVPADGTTCD
ncbi:MAG TPA: alpha/beta hydrolase [Actinotalea sp.]|nr:alpha/beta hydrolase [Actinotalea sp.]